jgi:molecular chaperone GrpE
MEHNSTQRTPEEIKNLEAEKEALFEELPSSQEEGQSPPDSSSEDMSIKLNQAEEEVADLKDQLLRSLAEMENLRKRTQRDREESSRYAISAFARDLLNVADNLRRALESFSSESKTSEETEPLTKTMETLVAGVEMTERELLAIFERQGIKIIAPQPGEKFDHNYHQAMMEVAKGDQESGTVVALFQPGYSLHDRLLRPAMVSVARS